jgi:hypothetical protein
MTGKVQGNMVTDEIRLVIQETKGAQVDTLNLPCTIAEGFDVASREFWSIWREKHRR